MACIDLQIAYMYTISFKPDSSNLRPEESGRWKEIDTTEHLFRSKGK